MMALIYRTMNIRIAIGIVAVCIIVVGIHIYDSNFRLHEPLITVIRDRKPNFHTPAFPAGHHLPTHITGKLHIGPATGVAILGDTTTIEQDSELVIEPGTTIAANEYASLIVEGTLLAEGTKQHPINFITNELREENRTWSGIFFADKSNGTISNTIFHHASPGISCEAGANTSITDTVFLLGNTAVFGPCRTVQDAPNTIQ